MEMIFWLVLFVVLLVVEIATMGLTTIWFAGGALIAFIAAYIHLGIGLQIVLFLAVSILLLVLTRPIAVKYFNQEREKTNVDSLIGQNAVVKEEINTIKATGRVEVNVMEWSAKTEHTEIIEVNTIVSIKGIQGVKLIVEKEEV